MYQLILILLCFGFSSIYAQSEDIVEFSSQYYSGTTTNFDGFIKKYESSDSEAYKLTMKAFIANMLLYSEFPTAGNMNAEAVSKLKNIFTEMTNFSNTVGQEHISAEFLTTLADIRIRIMSYVSINTLLEMSEQAKKNYEQALQKDSTYFEAYLGLGQWFFFAPNIGGGSLKKAINNYDLAEGVASHDYQKYLVHIWRSQAYFKSHKVKESAEELKKAAEIYPNGTLHKYAESQNKKGKIL